VEGETLIRLLVNLQKMWKLAGDLPRANAARRAAAILTDATHRGPS